ncbi:MAG: hypothetical protein V1870_04410 [Candidatus Aenigmatarchaeota archaeon]
MTRYVVESQRMPRNSLFKKSDKSCGVLLIASFDGDVADLEWSLYSMTSVLQKSGFGYATHTNVDDIAQSPFYVSVMDWKGSFLITGEYNMKTKDELNNYLDGLLAIPGMKELGNDGIIEYGNSHIHAHHAFRHRLTAVPEHGRDPLRILTPTSMQRVFHEMFG